MQEFIHEVYFFKYVTLIQLTLSVFIQNEL